MALAEDMEFYSSQISDEDYFDNLGRFYHNNYNLATIGSAKWKIADKKEIQFKDMEEKHILNCIGRFSKYHVLVGVFKLELLRRRI